MQTTPLPSAALERVRKLIASGQRKILGIAAAPGAGKSTLAQGLRQAFGSAVQVLPMDGFHLANSELQRLGRAGRKGAPDTFDAEGYVHLLHRLRQQQAGQTIYAPDFRREIEESVAGAIALEASTPLIVTEGNYLLLQDGTWQQVRAALDEAWYLELEPALRQQRLLARHMQFGRSREAALAWIAQTDEPNAQRIEGTRGRADWVLHAS
ncbi:MAG: nucleoside/nucleotide kinase family protein [Rhodoferax sp.]|nr:nucleoside/nucleotide kinase family protein [Rhodoferax sp.]